MNVHYRVNKSPSLVPISKQFKKRKALKPYIHFNIIFIPVSTTRHS